MLRRIVPGAVGAGIYQINLVVDMIIASFLTAGSISYLFFADRVTQLPLGIIGVGVGTALLPLMSRQLGAGDEAAALAEEPPVLAADDALDGDFVEPVLEGDHGAVGGEMGRQRR